MSEKTYKFVVAGTISMHVEVKASTLAEAVEKAQGSSTMTFCHMCSRVEEEEWGAADLDCDPAASPLLEAFVDDKEIDRNKAKKAWGGGQAK